MDTVFGAQASEVDVRAIGVGVTVADNCFAKLMYYLNSVKTCIPGLDLPRELTIHSRYYQLSNGDREKITILAYLVSPDVLQGKVFFAVDNENSILNGYMNEFYEIKKATTTLAVAASAEGAIVINGKRVEVAKIMIFTLSWLENYFLKPIREAVQYLRSSEHPGAFSSERTRLVNRRNSDDNRSCPCCCCAIL